MCTLKPRVLGVAAGCLIILSLAGPLSAGGWRRDSLWKDGRAEVAVYDSEVVMNGKPRQFQEQVVTLVEEVPEAENAKRSTRMIKQNTIQKIELENYPRNKVVSVFAP